VLTKYIRLQKNGLVFIAFPYPLHSRRYFLLTFFQKQIYFRAQGEAREPSSCFYGRRNMSIIELFN
jgi:hypothetical protein